MFIDDNSLKVTVGNTTIKLCDYITEVKYQYPKLWSDDSGRNLKGTMSGTLLGIFPKITVTFRKLSKSDLETLAPILDSKTQTVRYYDLKKRDYVSLSTYTGDWEITNNYYEKSTSFTISFIARSKR